MNGASFAIAIECVLCYLLLIKFDLMAAQLGRVVEWWCVHDKVLCVLYLAHVLNFI